MVWANKRGGPENGKGSVLTTLTQGILTKWIDSSRTKSERTPAQNLYLRNMNGWEGMNPREGQP
jgi:hypothetical protein